MIREGGRFHAFYISPSPGPLACHFKISRELQNNPKSDISDIHDIICTFHRAKMDLLGSNFGNWLFCREAHAMQNSHFNNANLVLTYLIKLV